MIHQLRPKKHVPTKETAHLNSPTCEACETEWPCDVIINEPYESIRQAWEEASNEGRIQFTSEPVVNCHVCDVKLEPVFKSTKRPTSTQFHGCLWLTFDGGYGMYFDDISDFVIGGKPPRAVLCEKCADDLCAKVPWIKDLIDPDPQKFS